MTMTQTLRIDVLGDGGSRDGNKGLQSNKALYNFALTLETPLPPAPHFVLCLPGHADSPVFCFLTPTPTDSMGHEVSKWGKVSTYDSDGIIE